MTAPAFTPPKALTQVLDAALTHKRSFIVQHNEDSGANPLVTFTAKWFPEGSDVPTEIKLTWHTRDTGTYRLFSAISRGHYHGWHDITVKKAVALLTGEICYFRSDAA